MTERSITPTAPLTAIGALPPGLLRESRKNMLAGLGLALLSFSLYILPAHWRPLTETAETRVAVVARGMLRSGDWLVPRLNGEVRAKKPPMPYWLVAAAAQALPSESAYRPVSELSAVLPSAALGAGTVFLVVLFGAHVLGRTAGVWAGFVLAFSHFFFRFAQTGTGEIPLAFFTTAALLAAGWIVCSKRPGLPAALGLGLGLGLAILTKWHVPLPVVLLPTVFMALAGRSFNGRKVALFGLGLLIAGGIAAPWALAIHERLPEATGVMKDEMGDIWNASGHAQSDRWIYYLYMWLSGLLPWTPLLLVAVPLGLLRRPEDQETHAHERLESNLAKFFLAAVVGMTLVLYAFPKQQYYYLLPLMPPLALAAGYALSRLNHPGGIREERLAWFLMGLGVVVGTLVALSPLWVNFLLFPLTVPLGVLTVALYWVAARQWVEGNGIGVALCVGFATYACLVGFTMFWTLDQRDRHPLARHADEFAHVLHSAEGQSIRLYAVKPPEPTEVLLYYLDWDRLYTLDDLMAESVDEQGRPRPEPSPHTRILITKAWLAERLGFQEPYDDPYFQELPKNHADWDWEPLRKLAERARARIPELPPGSTESE